MVAATADREGALRSPVLCSCGSQGCANTHRIVRIRAVAHVLNTEFVYFSYLDLTEWERKKKKTSHSAIAQVI